MGRLDEFVRLTSEVARTHFGFIKTELRTGLIFALISDFEYSAGNVVHALRARRAALRAYKATVRALRGAHLSKEQSDWALPKLKELKKAIGGPAAKKGTKTA